MGNVCRVILAVAIQGDDDLAFGRQHAAAYAPALAQIAAMEQHPKLGDFAAQRCQRRRRAVGRAIINKDDLMCRLGFEGGGNLPGQGGDIFGLILDRHDNGYGKRHKGIVLLFPAVLHGAVGGPYTGARPSETDG